MTSDWKGFVNTTDDEVEEFIEKIHISSRNTNESKIRRTCQHQTKEDKEEETEQEMEKFDEIF